jgi:hypothetical protein
MTITCVPGDGGACTILQGTESAIHVKPIDFHTAERVALWPISNGERLVDSNLGMGDPDGASIPVRLAAGRPVKVRVYPGRDVEGLLWDGTRYPAQHRQDWAEIFFNPEGPLIRTVASGGDRVKILAFQVDDSVKSIDLRVRYQGSRAEAWAGERLLGRSEGEKEAWRIPIRDEILAGLREVRFAFPGGGGRILEVRAETVVEKMAKIILADDNEPQPLD